MPPPSPLAACFSAVPPLVNNVPYIIIKFLYGSNELSGFSSVCDKGLSSFGNGAYFLEISVYFFYELIVLVVNLLLLYVYLSCWKLTLCYLFSLSHQVLLLSIVIC